MPSKSSEAALLDISDNARLAQEFVEGFDLRKFKADRRTVYAVTRCLEIISEASRRLPASVENRHPGIARKDIAGAGADAAGRDLRSGCDGVLGMFGVG